MDQIRTIIVDDEEVCREGLNTLVSEMTDFEVISVCKNGREAITIINRLKPDLLLLDIQMPEISGFDVLERISHENIPEVVFITAYDEFAIKAFEVNAIDYILKPFSQKRFEQALSKAKENIEGRDVNSHNKKLLEMIASLQLSIEGEVKSSTDNDSVRLKRIMIKVNGSISFVEVADIDWIEGADYYVYLHSGNKAHLYRESLKNLETKLAPEQFIRIHMSTIVNLDKVKEIKSGLDGNWYVILENKKKLKVSRRRKKQLFDLGASNFGFKV